MHPDLTAGRYNLQLHSIIHHFCLLDKRENGVFEIFFAAAACFLGRLPALPLVCFLSPILPPALAERSSPPGKGENHSFLMQGASPLASPRLSRRQHELTRRSRYPTGACPAGCRLTVPLWCPQGGLPSLPPAYPAFSLLYCPQPPSPPGKGGTFSFLMQGAPPLASPGLNRKQHELTRRSSYPTGACPVGCRLTVPLWYPQGGLTFFAASLLLPLACFAAPIPPTPFPAGRGRLKVYFAGATAPGTPALNRLRHLQSQPNRCPRGTEPRRHWLSLPLWKAQWGLNLRGTGYPCRCGKRNGGLAFFVARRPCL